MKHQTVVLSGVSEPCSITPAVWTQAGCSSFLIDRTKDEPHARAFRTSWICFAARIRVSIISGLLSVLSNAKFQRHDASQFPPVRTKRKIFPRFPWLCFKLMYIQSPILCAILSKRSAEIRGEALRGCVQSGKVAISWRIFFFKLDRCTNTKVFTCNKL